MQSPPTRLLASRWPMGRLAAFDVGFDKGQAMATLGRFIKEIQLKPGAKLARIKRVILTSITVLKHVIIK